MTSDRQFRLLPKRGDDLRAALHGFEPSAGLALDLVDAAQAQIGEFALFGIAKEVFDRIEFGRIAGQALEDDLVAKGVDVVAYEAAAVPGQAVPDDQELGTDLRPERLEEFDQLRAADRTVKEAEVKAPEGDARDQRELLAVETVLQCRRAALGRPGLDAGRPFAQSGFVDEDDGSGLSAGLFLAPASAQTSTAGSLPRRAGSPARWAAGWRIPVRARCARHARC